MLLGYFSGSSVAPLVGFTACFCSFSVRKYQGEVCIFVDNTAPAAVTGQICGVKWLLEELGIIHSLSFWVHERGMVYDQW